LRATLRASVIAAMGNTMSYSLAAAAGACGVNKSTILRAIQAGKISAAKDEHGEWHVEPAELHRVYPPASERTGATQRYAVVDASAVAAEAHQRAALAVEVAMLREQLADARHDRNAWREQAQRLAIADQRARERRRPWWKRLVGSDPTQSAGHPRPEL
jgi:hypothetical protein